MQTLSARCTVRNAAIARPTALERILILVAQGAFYVGFFLLYLLYLVSRIVLASASGR